MKFTIGWQNNESLKTAILSNLASVSEIYFPWEGFTTGRGMSNGLSDQRRLEADLEEFVAAGLATNLLLNGNCYGSRSQSREFFQSIGDTVDFLVSAFKLSSVTTTSPLIAKFIKTNFPAIEVRASVNMEIGTVEGLEYVSEWFDAFYAKREFNWDFRRLSDLRQWTSQNGKKLYLLANSGCLNFCSARTFHDNLVAHQHRIAEMDNAYEFKGVCHIFLGNSKNRGKLLNHSNFIRPEDVGLFESLCDGMKLATRTNRNPAAVVEAYCGGRYPANILELTEPSHAENMYPLVFDNKRFPSDYAERRLHCDKRCASCGYCDSVQSEVEFNIEQLGKYE